MTTSKMTRNLLMTCAALSCLTTSAFASRDTKLDRMMYTINPEIALSGPVYYDNSSSDDKSKYVSEVMRIILKEAHKKGERYLAAGDTQAYYAVLTMALTVPLHEGLYIQYRGVEGTDACNSDANNGVLVSQTGETNTEIFNKYFKDPQRPFLPNCEDIQSDNIKQIIRGGDGTDLSIMQVSIRWHFADFLANKKYEDIVQTVNYGLGHLMDGFNPVYRNVSKYKCIGGGGFFKKKEVNYVNLIRGIWAGKYNSGSITKTCRFAEFNSPYKGHDRGFERNLNKILELDKTLAVDLVGTFKLEDDVLLAVKEVRDNLLNNTNVNTSLKEVLKK